MEIGMSAPPLCLYYPRRPEARTQPMKESTTGAGVVVVVDVVAGVVVVAEII